MVQGSSNGETDVVLALAGSICLGECLIQPMCGSYFWEPNFNDLIRLISATELRRET